MHESGLVEELIHELEKVVASNSTGRVLKVEVAIGTEAGFSPEHFEDHFREASAGTIAENSVLVIRAVDGDSVTLEGMETED